MLQATDRVTVPSCPHVILSHFFWSHCWILLPRAHSWLRSHVPSPWDRSLALPVIINKVLLEPRHVHSSSINAYLPTQRVVLTDTAQRRSRICTNQPLQRVFASPTMGGEVCGGGCFVNTHFSSRGSFSHTARRSLTNISEVIEFEQ